MLDRLRDVVGFEGRLRFFDLLLNSSESSDAMKSSISSTGTVSLRYFSFRSCDKPSSSAVASLSSPYTSSSLTTLRALPRRRV